MTTELHYSAIMDRGLIPKDETRGYRVIQRRLLQLRELGVIPYGHIADNARTVHRRNRYQSPEDYARVAAEFYLRDYWADSSVRVEVWLEKDALVGVLRPVVVEECGLDLFVTRGYASVSYLQSAADFIREDGRPTYIYLLTDFDPSGLGIAETVCTELQRRTHSTEVHVERLALNREQVEELSLPTRPTKKTDSRSRKFIREHGTDCVELDALSPETLRSLTRASIERHMEPEKLHGMKLAEEQERD